MDNSTRMFKAVCQECHSSGICTSDPRLKPGYATQCSQCVGKGYEEITFKRGALAPNRKPFTGRGVVEGVGWVGTFRQDEFMVAMPYERFLRG